MMLQIVSESSNSGCNPDINPCGVYKKVSVIMIFSETALLIFLLIITSSLSKSKIKFHPPRTQVSTIKWTLNR